MTLSIETFNFCGIIVDIYKFMLFLDIRIAVKFMPLYQIYNIKHLRPYLLIIPYVLFFGASLLKAQSEKSGVVEKVEGTIVETQEQVDRIQSTEEQLQEQQEKVSKFKAFVRDSIPAYTDQFGSYLKGILERQNRLDYLDEVPKPIIQKKTVPIVPERISYLKEQYQKPALSEIEWTGIDLPPFSQPKSKKLFKREIYGFHSFWDGNKYELYDLNAITRIGYIGYLIDETNGNPKKLPNWENTELHKRAVQYQIDVDLVAQILDSTSTRNFLSNEKAWANFADNIINEISEKNGSGIVIDFFGLEKSQSPHFLEFIRYMKYRLGEASPRFELTISLPPNDIDNNYQSKEISRIADRVLLMAMDYQNYEGNICGPTSPLVSNLPKVLSIDQSFTDLVKNGVKPEKIILVLGLDARQYVMDEAAGTTNDAKLFAHVPFATFEEDYCVRFRPHQQKETPQEYITFSSNDQWYINWGEHLPSVSLKADYTNTKNLKGLGLYQLGGAVSKYSKLWPLLYKKFAFPKSVTKKDILKDYPAIPEDANIDSILSVNQALIMTAINLSENPFLPEKPEISQLAKAQTYSSEYKGLMKTFGMFFSILTICALLGLVLAMFDEKVRIMMLYDNVYLIVVPILMIFITITLRLLGIIFNSGLEFIVGGLFGLGIHYLFQNYVKRRARVHENTP